MKTIEITIDETGESTIDLVGFNGQGCGKVLEDFAGADKAKLVREKPEYRQQPQGLREGQRG